MMTLLRHRKEITSLITYPPSLRGSFPLPSLPLSVPPVPVSLSVFLPNFLTSRI